MELYEARRTIEIRGVNMVKSWAEITDFIDEEYLETIGVIGLQYDPFPMIAPKKVDYWADNEELFHRLRAALIDAMLFKTSNIYVFYGDVGVGKTFVAHFMCEPTGLNVFFSELPEGMIKDQLVFKIEIVVPRRTGELTSTAHREIISYIIEEIRTDSDLRNAFLENIQSVPSGNVRRAFNYIAQGFRKVTLGAQTYDLSDNEGFKFIIDDRSKVGKIRDLNQVSEIITYLLYVVFHKYDRVNIIMDECENLSEAPLADRYQFSDLIKTIYGNITNKLNIFLLYTEDTYSEIEKTLQRALLDRIKDKILFKRVDNRDDIIIYISECIEKRGKIKSSELIDNDVLEEFSDYLINKYSQISFRDINKEMHNLISKCYKFKIESMGDREFIFKIDSEAYMFYKSIIGIR